MRKTCLPIQWLLIAVPVLADLPPSEPPAVEKAVQPGEAGLAQLIRHANRQLLKDPEWANTSVKDYITSTYSLDADYVRDEQLPDGSLKIEAELTVHRDGIEWDSEAIDHEIKNAEQAVIDSERDKSKSLDEFAKEWVRTKVPNKGPVFIKWRNAAKPKKLALSDSEHSAEVDRITKEGDKRIAEAKQNVRTLRSNKKEQDQAAVDAAKLVKITVLIDAQTRKTFDLERIRKNRGIKDLSVKAISLQAEFDAAGIINGGAHITSMQLEAIGQP